MINIQQNSAECFAPALTKPRVYPNILGRHISPHSSERHRLNLVNGSKKHSLPQQHGCAQRSRDSYLDKLATLIPRVEDAAGLSSTYVAHTHKLLTDLQASVAYQIHVVRDFDYFLLEEVSVHIAFLHIVGHHKVVIAQHGRLILILRWPIT